MSIVAERATGYNAIMHFAKYEDAISCGEQRYRVTWSLLCLQLVFCAIVNGYIVVHHDEDHGCDAQRVGDESELRVGNHSFRYTYAHMSNE